MNKKEKRNQLIEKLKSIQTEEDADYIKKEHNLEGDIPDWVLCWNPENLDSEFDGFFSDKINIKEKSILYGRKTLQLACGKERKKYFIKDADVSPELYVSPLNRDDNLVFITEGPGDALAISYLGFNVISSYGIGNAEKSIEIAKEEGFKEIVIIVDADTAGRKFAKKFEEDYLIDVLPNDPRWVLINLKKKELEKKLEYLQRGIPSVLGYKEFFGETNKKDNSTRDLLGIKISKTSPVNSARKEVPDISLAEIFKIAYTKKWAENYIESDNLEALWELICENGGVSINVNKYIFDYKNPKSNKLYLCDKFIEYKNRQYGTRPEAAAGQFFTAVATAISRNCVVSGIYGDDLKVIFPFFYIAPSQSGKTPLINELVQLIETSVVKRDHNEVPVETIRDGTVPAIVLTMQEHVLVEDEEVLTELYKDLEHLKKSKRTSASASNTNTNIDPGDIELQIDDKLIEIEDIIKRRDAINSQRVENPIFIIRSDEFGDKILPSMKGKKDTNYDISELIKLTDGKSTIDQVRVGSGEKGTKQSKTQRKKKLRNISFNFFLSCNNTQAFKYLDSEDVDSGLLSRSFLCIIPEWVNQTKEEWLAKLSYDKETRDQENIELKKGIEKIVAQTGRDPAQMDPVCLTDDINIMEGVKTYGYLKFVYNQKTKEELCNFIWGLKDNKEGISQQHRELLGKINEKMGELVLKIAVVIQLAAIAENEYVPKGLKWGNSPHTNSGELVKPQEIEMDIQIIRKAIYVFEKYLFPSWKLLLANITKASSPVGETKEDILKNIYKFGEPGESNRNKNIISIDKKVLLQNLNDNYTPPTFNLACSALVESGKIKVKKLVRNKKKPGEIKKEIVSKNADYHSDGEQFSLTAIGKKHVIESSK